MNKDKRFEKKEKRLQGHTYRPFENLLQLLREKGLYPKEEKK
jgi:hypothetical protein